METWPSITAIKLSRDVVIKVGEQDVREIKECFKTTSRRHIIHRDEAGHAMSFDTIETQELYYNIFSYGDLLIKSINGRYVEEVIY